MHPSGAPLPVEKAVEKGISSSLMGIVFNLILAIFKCLAGYLGHSFALIADGIESVSDVVSSTVVFFGLKVAIKPPDEDHPYGHGKAEPVAAIIVSLALVLAAIFIAVESIRRIREPHPLPETYTLWVLLIVVVVKVLLGRYVSSVGNDLESTAVKSDAWHHLSDAITSGFAFVGISVALITKQPTADDWAALCAAPIIMFNAVRQIRAPFGELLDATPSPKVGEAARAIAESLPDVIGIEKCNVRKTGFRYYIDLHAIVDGDISVRRGHQIAHEIEDAVLKSAPQVAEVLVHIEPNDSDQLARLL